MFTFRRALLAIACAAAATPASAQFRDASRPNTKGFFMKFSVVENSFSADSVNTRRETGVGTFIGIGVGFNEYVALAFDGGGTFYRHNEVDKYRLDHFDLGVRLHYPRDDHRIVPYGDIAVSGAFLREDSLAFANGPTGRSLAGKHDIDCSGMTAGAGLLYFVTSTFAVDVSAHESWGEFRTSVGTSLRPTLALKTSAVRFNLGVALYPDKHFKGLRPPGY